MAKCRFRQENKKQGRSRADAGHCRRTGIFGGNSLSAPLLAFPGVAWAHGGEGLASWPFSPDILVASVLVAVLYLRGWRRRRGRPGAPSGWRHASFFGGLAALLAALQSPVDTLAEHSFAMHQVQHLLLRGVGPMLLFLALPQPLLAAGLPRFLRERALAPLLASRAAHAFFALFAHPLAATFWLVAVPIFWHLPRYHDRSVLDDSVHYLMHVTMLLSALVFFWRVLDPRPAPLGASYATRIVMCSAAIAGTVPLGAYHSLKSTALYASYDEKGRLWGLAALSDEQLGGFVVWIPGSMMFVVLLLVVIRLWSTREDRVEALRQRGLRPGSAALDTSAANRALALRLAAIALLVAAGVATVAILYRFMP